MLKWYPELIEEKIENIVEFAGTVKDFLNRAQEINMCQIGPQETKKLW